MATLLFLHLALDELAVSMIIGQSLYDLLHRQVHVLGCLLGLPLQLYSKME